MTTKKILRYAGPLAGLILFCIAVMVLRKELHQLPGGHHFDGRFDLIARDILAEMNSISGK